MLVKVKLKGFPAAAPFLVSQASSFLFLFLAPNFKYFSKCYKSECSMLMTTCCTLSFNGVLRIILCKCNNIQADVLKNLHL